MRVHRGNRMVIWHAYASATQGTSASDKHQTTRNGSPVWVIDAAFLETLPAREFSNGMAEVIKVSNFNWANDTIYNS